MSEVEGVQVCVGNLIPPPPLKQKVLLAARNVKTKSMITQQGVVKRLIAWAITQISSVLMCEANM